MRRPIKNIRGTLLVAAGFVLGCAAGFCLPYLLMPGPELDALLVTSYQKSLVPIGASLGLVVTLGLTSWSSA